MIRSSAVPSRIGIIPPLGADVKGSDSHQRVMRYDFGDMRCLVRFKSDSYLPELLSKAEGHRSQPKRQ